MIEATDPLTSLGLRQTPQAKDDRELGQEDFLTLMLAQIKSQDPLNPMENAEFFSQMAQMSTVQGLNDLNSSFADLAGALQVNQGLQAATLVGRNAMVEADNIKHESGNVQAGAVGLAAGASDVRIQITDESGALVKEIHLGDLPGGITGFEWDGLDSKGQPAASGRYNFTALASSGGSQIELPTLLAGEVTRVNLNSTGRAYLELAGLGTVPFGDIRQIL